MKRRSINVGIEKNVVPDERAVRIIPGVNVKSRSINELIRLSLLQPAKTAAPNDLRTDTEKRRFPSYYFHTSFTGRQARDLYAPAKIDNSPDCILDHETTDAYAREMHFAAYRIFRGFPRQDMLRERHRTLCEAIIRGNRALVYDRVNNILDICDLPGMEEDFEEMGSYKMFNATHCFNPWSNTKYSTYVCNALNNEFSRLLEKAQQSPEHPFSLISDNETDPVGEETTLPGRYEDPLLKAENEDALAHIHKRAAVILNSEELEVLRRRFGWKEEERKDIGLLLGYTGERIRQFEVDGLDKLRLDIMGIPIPWRRWNSNGKPPPPGISRVS